MGQLWLPNTVWDKQPVTKAGITDDNLSNELDFAFYCTSTGVFDAKNGNDVAFVNDQTVVSTPEGFAFVGQSSGIKQAFTLKSRMTSNRAFTLMFIRRSGGFYSGLSGAGKIFELTWGGSGHNIYLRGPDLDNFRRWYTSVYGSSVFQTPTFGPVDRIFDKQSTVVIFRYIPGTSITLIDKYGRTTVPITEGSQGSVQATPIDAQFFTDFNSHMIPLGAGWTRALNDNECERLMENPWSLFSKSSTVTMIPEYVACTKQPQGVAEIDRMGLGKGMQMLLMQRGGRLVDIVNPSVAWNPINGATSGISPSGAVSRFNGSTSGVFQATGYASMGDVNGTFFVWMPRFGAYDSAGSIFLSTPSADLYLQITSDGRVFVTQAQAPGAPSIANSRNRSVVFSSRAAKTAVMFDGVARVSNVDNRVMWPGTKTLNFGGYTGGAEWDTDADIVIAGYTSESWTEAQAKAFHDNPWQLFRQKVNLPLDATIKENRKPVIRESNLLGTSKRKLSDVNVTNTVSGAVKKVLNRQPAGASSVEIAWSNPITRSLFDLFTPPYVGHADVKGMLGKISQPTSERSTSLTNNVGAKPTPMGLAYTAFNLNCGVGFVNTGASVFTSYCRMKLNSFTSGDCNFLGDAFNLGVGLYAGTGATFYVELYTGTFIKTPIALTAELGKYYDIVTVTSATNVKLYIDGVLMFDQAPSYWNGQGRHGILVTGLVTIGAIDFVTVAGWTRALSFAEVQSISRNPWQLFKNQSQLILPK